MLKYFFNTLVLTFLLEASGHAQTLQPVDVNMENVTYPFPVQFISLQLQGESLKMAYMDVKPDKPNGKTIVLLHGKNFNGSYWETTTRALAEKGFRVIMPDQIGFGKSSKPHRIQYTFQLLSSNTRALLDSLGVNRTILLGHSMGGMLATRFTLMYPQLVEKLVLENPLGLEDWKLKIPYQTVDEWYKSELKQNHEGIKKYQLQNYYGGNWKPAYDKWVNMQAGWTINPEYPKIAWNSALTYEMIFTQPVLYEFGLITCPTLLLIGLDDRTAPGKNLVPDAISKTMGNYPRLGKETANRIKGSKLVEIENTGHMPHIQSFDKFINALIPFVLR